MADITVPSLETLEKSVDLEFLHRFIDDTQIDELIEKYKKIGVKPEIIPQILTDCMIMAEKLKNVSGEDKKKFAENLFNNVLKSLIKTGANILIAFIPALAFLSPLIDVIVDATKGLIDINQVKKCCSGMFFCCKKKEK
jgi:hypothetical protein